MVLEPRGIEFLRRSDGIVDAADVDEEKEAFRREMESCS